METEHSDAPGTMLETVADTVSSPGVSRIMYGVPGIPEALTKYWRPPGTGDSLRPSHQPPGPLPTLTALRNVPIEASLTSASCRSGFPA